MRLHTTSKLRFVVAGVLAAMGAFSASAGELYSVFYDNRFGEIDDSTGAYTPISTLPVSNSAGIAYVDGNLYVQSMSGTLLDVDPISGASSIIGDSGLQMTSAGFSGGLDGLFAIDYSSNLYSINPSTGAATLIGATGLGADNGNWDTSLSYSNGSLYFTEGGGGEDDTLYSVNVATGRATNLGNTGVTGIAGSAIVDGNLDLFQYHWSGGTDYIYSAPVGSTNFAEIGKLQTQVVDGAVPLTASAATESEITASPEPFSFALFGSGLIVLALRGRWSHWKGAMERVCSPTRYPPD